MSARPSWIPSLVTPEVPNAIPYLEDFFDPSVAPYYYRSGTTGYGYPFTHQTYTGHPAWVVTIIGNPTSSDARNFGSVGCSGTSYTSTTRAYGVFDVYAGFSADQGLIVSLSGRGYPWNSAPNSIFGAWANPLQAVGLWRLAMGGVSSPSIRGWGWANLGEGIDWLSDPDTALASTDALIYYHNSHSAYGGAALGDLVVRAYNKNGTHTSVTLLTSAQIMSGIFYKFEVNIYGNLFNKTCDFYVDRVLKGTLNVANSTLTTGLCPTFGVIAKQVSATGRFLRLDTYYQELAQENNELR